MSDTIETFNDILSLIWSTIKVTYKLVILSFEVVTILFINIINSIIQKLKGIITPPPKQKVVSDPNETQKHYSAQTTLEWLFNNARSRIRLKSVGFWLLSALIVPISLQCNRYEQFPLRILYMIVSIIFGKWYLLYFLMYYMVLQNSCVPLRINKAMIAPTEPYF